MESLSAALPDTTASIVAFMGTAAKEGALTFREKELIAIAVALYSQCAECVAVHCQKALEAGCTREEIL